MSPKVLPSDLMTICCLPAARPPRGRAAPFTFDHQDNGSVGSSVAPFTRTRCQGGPAQEVAVKRKDFAASSMVEMLLRSGRNDLTTTEPIRCTAPADAEYHAVYYGHGERQPKEEGAPLPGSERTSIRP